MFSLTMLHVRKTGAGCVTPFNVRHGTMACKKKKNSERWGEGVNTKWRNSKRSDGGRKQRQLPSAAEPLKGPPDHKGVHLAQDGTTNAEMTVL